MHYVSYVIAFILASFRWWRDFTLKARYIIYIYKDVGYIRLVKRWIECSVPMMLLLGVMLTFLWVCESLFTCQCWPSQTFLLRRIGMIALCLLVATLLAT